MHKNFLPRASLSQTLVGHRVSWHCAVSADGNTALSTSDKNAIVWDTKTGARLAVLSGHANGIIRCSLSANGRIAATVSHDGTLRTWETNSGTLLKTQCNAHMGTPRDCALTADGRTIFATFSNPENAVLRFDMGVRNFFISWSTACNRQAQTCSASNNGDIVAVAVGRDGGEGGIRVMNGVTGRILRVWHCASYPKVAVDGRGLNILIADDKRLALRSLRSSKDEPRNFQGYFGGEHGSCCLSKDGRRVVARYKDGDQGTLVFAVWDAESTALIALLDGHIGMPNHCAISENGTKMVTTATDHTARVWCLDVVDDAERSDWPLTTFTRVEKARELFRRTAREGRVPTLNFSDSYCQILALLSCGDFQEPLSYLDVENLMRQASMDQPGRLREEEFALVFEAVVRRDKNARS
jgi:WD40 repeat protein